MTRLMKEVELLECASQAIRELLEQRDSFEDAWRAANEALWEANSRADKAETERDSYRRDAEVEAGVADDFRADVVRLRAALEVICSGEYPTTVEEFAYAALVQQPPLDTISEGFTSADIKRDTKSHG